MADRYDKHSGYAFSQAFRNTPLVELKARYASGERPHVFAYCGIPFRPHHGFDDEIETLSWLLSTDFEDPTGDLWLFVAGTSNAAEYVKTAMKIRPRLQTDPIAANAITNLDMKMLEAAAEIGGWKNDYIVTLERLPFAQKGSPVHEQWLQMRTKLLANRGHSEGTYLRWKLENGLA